MTDIAIRVGNLNKCCRLYGNPHDRRKQFLASRLQRSRAWST